MPCGDIGHIVSGLVSILCLEANLHRYTLPIATDPPWLCVGLEFMFGYCPLALLHFLLASKTISKLALTPLVVADDPKSTTLWSTICDVEIGF